MFYGNGDQDWRLVWSTVMLIKSWIYFPYFFCQYVDYGAHFQNHFRIKGFLCFQKKVDHSFTNCLHMLTLYQHLLTGRSGSNLEFGNYWKGIKISKNLYEVGGFPFWSSITWFPGLVVNDMMMMVSMGWPYDSMTVSCYVTSGKNHTKTCIWQTNQHLEVCG